MFLSCWGTGAGSRQWKSWLVTPMLAGPWARSSGAGIKFESSEDSRNKSHVTRNEETKLVLHIEGPQMPQAGF